MYSRLVFISLFKRGKKESSFISIGIFAVIESFNYAKVHAVLIYITSS